MLERCAEEPGAEAALQRLRLAASRGERLHAGEPVVLEGDGGRAVAVHFKGAPLGRRPGWRHAVRGAVGLGVPRLREFDNLRWLRAREFDAPAPLAACVRRTKRRPTWQGIATRHVEGALPLEAWIDARSPEERGALVDALGRTLGRLHALGFVHRDLYARNLLVHPARPERPILLDAWRGGVDVAARLEAGLARRDALYDLACLFVHLPALLTRTEQRRLLAHYCERRGWAPREADRRLVRLARARRAAAQRERARGRTGEPDVRLDWERVELATRVSSTADARAADS